VYDFRFPGLVGSGNTGVGFVGGFVGQTQLLLPGLLCFLFIYKRRHGKAVFLVSSFSLPFFFF
jgi:hypothetical protein